MGNFSATGSRTYFLWVEDAAGRVSGWLPNGSFVEEIPGSSASLQPLVPSDPEQEDTALVADGSWPFAISIDDAQSNYKVFVQASTDTDYSIDAAWFVEGRSDLVANGGTLRTGELKQIEISQPVSSALGITSIRALGGGNFEVSLQGGNSTEYEFRSSPTLNFSPGTLVENLVKGDQGDPGVIGGANQSVVTTDAAGQAKVRIALPGASNFVRAQSVD